MSEEIKNDKMLLAGIEDKFRQCCDQYRLTYTGFLDLRQRSMAEQLCRQLKVHSENVSCVFFGGYSDAERTVAAFLPDYAVAEDLPLAVIRVSAPAAGRKLTHRDYLGSLVGLGLKRERIGDILVYETGADIIIMEDIRDFILTHYGQVGRTEIRVEAIPLAELQVPDVKTTLIKDTVASLRLDNVVSSAFSLSRAKAAEAIRGGIVFVNGMQSEKVDMQIKEGDKLVLRGKGKAYLQEVGGQTRKDRIFIVIERYV